MKRSLLLYVTIIILTCLLNIVPALAANGVVMNFTDVDISTMVKFISELTGKNFVLDERVKGKISIFSPSKLTTDEAFSLFTSVLELKGFALVQTGKIYKVVPSVNAKQSGMKFIGAGDKIPISDAYLARVFDLEQISSQEALTFLQPLVSREGHIGSFGSGNMLLVVDNASNILKIAEIVKTIDTKQRREGAELVYLKNGSAENIATILKEWISGKGVRQTGAATQQFVTAGGIQVVADTRLNALLLFGSESDKQDVRRLIAMLDVTPPEASSKVNVYFLENADATDLAKVLDGVVKGITTQPAAGQAAAHTSPLDSGKVTITPDKASNSLIIMASPNDYNNLHQVIKKLDRRSKQVFVQVLIAEVSLDKSRKLGMQSTIIGTYAINEYFGVGGFYDPFGVLATLAPVASTATGSSSSATTFPVGGVPANIGAVMQALDSNELINILSTPNILTTDNKEAEINVGENVPFQASSNTIVGGGTTTSIDRKDIGINLKIKPQITEGDYIRMDIYQEISAVKNDKGQAIDIVTTKRSAKTSVVVKDKETIVIGGLIQDTEDTTINKVPFFGDIPGLGWLFKTKVKTRKKTNLMILLTPHVVKDARDLSTISDAQRNLYNESSKKTGKVDVEKELSIKKVQAPAQQPQEKQAQ